MKFEPQDDQIIGRMLIKKVRSSIIRPDETKNTTKFVLVDAVGIGVKGIKVGDVVVPKALGEIVLDQGTIRRPWLEKTGWLFRVTDIDIEKDLKVQTDDGTKYVEFGSSEAAQPLGESPRAEEKAA